MRASWFLALSAALGMACTVEPVTQRRPTDPNDPNNPNNPDPNNPDPQPAAVCGTSKIGRPMLRRLTAREYVRTLEDVFPEVRGQWSASFNSDSISRFGFDNHADFLMVGKQMAEAIAGTAEGVASAVTGASFGTILPCSATAPDRNCATEFVTKYGKRLFRRALTPTEQNSYLALFDQALPTAGFPGAIGWVTRALIQSPATVYRREVGVPDATNPKKYKLTPDEIATALAYTYAGTTPSDAVLAGSEAGDVDSPAKRVAGANVLLTGSNHEALQRFFESWLGYSLVTTAARPAVMNFEALRPEMIEETRHFIQEVVFTGRGGPRELLTAPFTTPSTSLATMYGFPAPASPYARVDRPAGRGIGILAQGSVLASRAGTNSSSPTKRGLLVFTRFLCKEPEPVPANVPVIAPPNPGVVTTRQRYEQSHAAGACASCHRNFDPIGFGFEHFDEAGRFRADEGGLPIDSASHVPNGAEVLFEFSGLEELAQGLANQPLVNECISGTLGIYAFGGAADCLGETRRLEFVANTLGFTDYYASLAAEPHFGEREIP